MPKIFFCNFCPYKAAYPQYLKVHLRTHTGEKPFQCSFCPYKSTQKSALNTHLQTHVDTILKCELCSYETKRTNEMDEHKKSHYEGVTYSCDKCAFVSKRNQCLEDHLKTHIVVQDHENKVKNKIKKKKLVKQKQLTYRKKYECPICPYKVNVKLYYQRHLHFHRSDSHVRKYRCDVCPYIAYGKSQLEYHLNMHSSTKPYECDKCDHKARSKSNLKKHMKLMHSKVKLESSYEGKNNVNISINNSNESKCGEFALKKDDQTKKCFSVEDEIITTSKNNTDLGDLLIDLKSEDIDTKKFSVKVRQFKCSLCPFMAHNLCEYQKHKAQHFNKRYKCRLCPYQINDKMHYMRHVNLHSKTNGFRYRCGQCQYGCNSEHLLKYHQRVHNGEKPFRCKHCTRSFIDKGHLTQHFLRKHSF